MDYTVGGILQARILEWVAMPFSRGSSQPRDRTQVSLIADGFFTSWATREAQVFSIICYTYTRGWGEKALLEFHHWGAAVFGVGEGVSYQFLTEEQVCLVTGAPWRPAGWWHLLPITRQVRSSSGTLKVVVVDSVAAVVAPLLGGQQREGEWCGRAQGGGSWSCLPALECPVFGQPGPRCPAAHPLLSLLQAWPWWCSWPESWKPWPGTSAWQCWWGSGLGQPCLPSLCSLDFTNWGGVLSRCSLFP